jgi:hypothetical protein
MSYNTNSDQPGCCQYLPSFEQGPPMPSDGFARKPPYRIPSPKLHGIIAPWMLRPDLDSNNTSLRTSADYPLEHEGSIEENIRNDLGQPSISEPDINDEIWYSGEDTLLRRLRESGNLSWNDVSKQFRRRSAHACCKRYELLLMKDLPKENPFGTRWALGKRP